MTENLGHICIQESFIHKNHPMLSPLLYKYHHMDTSIHISHGLSCPSFLFWEVKYKMYDNHNDLCGYWKNKIYNRAYFVLVKNCCLHIFSVQSPFCVVSALFESLPQIPSLEHNTHVECLQRIPYHPCDALHICNYNYFQWYKPLWILVEISWITSWA